MTSADDAAGSRDPQWIGALGASARRNALIEGKGGPRVVMWQPCVPLPWLRLPLTASSRVAAGALHHGRPDNAAFEEKKWHEEHHDLDRKAHRQRMAGGPVCEGGVLGARAHRVRRRGRRRAAE